MAAGYDYDHTYKGNQQNWSAPHSENWTKQGYDVPNHTRRPVIIDAKDRKTPVISYNSTDSHAPQVLVKEKTIEHIHYKATLPIQEYKIHPLHKIDRHLENHKEDNYSTRPPVVYQYKVHSHADGEDHIGPVIYRYKVHPHATGDHYEDYHHANIEDHKDDIYKTAGSHLHKVHQHAKHDSNLESYKVGNYTRLNHIVHSQENNDHFGYNQHTKRNDHDNDHHSFHNPSSPEARGPNGTKFGLLSAKHWRSTPHHGSAEKGKLLSATNNIEEAMMMLKMTAEPIVYGLKESIDSSNGARWNGSSTPRSPMYGPHYEHHGPTLGNREAAKKVQWHI